MKPHTHLKVARVLARLLDSQFSFFGKKFGLDPLVSAIPIIGDFIGLALSLYIVAIAIKLELPIHKIFVMLVHSFLDFFIGSIPILGLFADFVYGANTRNLKILEEHASSFVYGEVVE